jgi:hypothetical protein
MDRRQALITLAGVPLAGATLALPSVASAETGVPPTSIPPSNVPEPEAYHLYVDGALDKRFSIESLCEEMQDLLRKTIDRSDGVYRVQACRPLGLRVTSNTMSKTTGGWGVTECSEMEIPVPSVQQALVKDTLQKLLVEELQKKQLMRELQNEIPLYGVS